MSDDTPVRRDTIVPGAPQHDRGARLRAGTLGVSEFLAFRVAHESYALPLPSVREILKLGPITEVPRSPKDVLGIVSVRGRVTTVLDLRTRLRMPTSETTKQTRVLLVDGGDEILGLLVDEVLQVYRLRAEQIEPANVEHGERSDYVIGIGRPGAQRAQAKTSTRRRVRQAASGIARTVQAMNPEPSRTPAPIPPRAELLILLDPALLLRR